MSCESLPYGRGNSNYSIQPKRRSPVVISILVVVGIIALLVSIILPQLCRASEQANRVKCASNMKQIGLAAVIWAQAHAGKFPDDLDTLLTDENLTPAVFNCPTSADSPAQGATAKLLVEDIHRPGHLSYVYIGKGLTTDCPPDTVVLYELPRNHSDGDMSVSGQFRTGPQSDGMNVLCADGHVEWIGAFEADALLKRVKDGPLPVLLPDAIRQPSHDTAAPQS